MWELLSGQQPIPGGWQCFIAINSFDTPITLLVAHIMPGWHEVTPGHYKILCTFRTLRLRRSKIPGFWKTRHTERRRYPTACKLCIIMMPMIVPSKTGSIDPSKDVKNASD